MAGSQPATPAPDPQQQRVAAAAALAIARVAQADLRLNGGPDERDFWIAAQMLGIASTLNPKDADILRLLIEAEGGAGESDEVDRLSRRLLELDPQDTVTQLRVISDAISNHQRVEGRLAAYDRFLGQEGRNLDASVRSRLALDAALLAREMGDIEGFARRLTMATELDKTNKDAATLALTFFAARTNDAVGRLELLINVLVADPFDQDVVLAIGRELSTQGAFTGAARFYAYYQTLCAIRGVEMDPLATNELQVVDWMTNGAQSFVDRATSAIEDDRAETMRQRERAKAAGVEEDQLPDPQSRRLPVDTERLRVLASIAIGRADQIDYAVREMNETIERSKAEILDLHRQQELGMDEKAVKEFLRVMTQESTWLRIWAGRDLDGAARDLAQLKSEPATDPRDVQRMEAWLKIRRGQLDEAETELRALKDESLALVGLAAIAELRGRTVEALDQYLAIAQRAPGSPAGAFALTRAEILNEQAGAPRKIEESATAKRLDALALGVPDWLEGMAESPLEFETLQADIVPPESGMLGVLDRLVMRVRLRNTSRMPLGLGPDRPLNSRLLLVPTVRVGSETVRRPSLHGVVNIDRRLRLMPREEMTINVLADNGAVGLLLQETLRDGINVRYRVLQGFRSNRGMFEEGPQCLSLETNGVMRPSSRYAYATASELESVFDKGSPMEVAEAALAMRDRVGTASAERFSGEEAQSLLDALLRRFPHLSRDGKLLLLAILPNSSAMTAMDRLDDVAQHDPDPMVVRFTMMARLPGVDAQALQESQWIGNDLMARTAKAVRERLADNRRTFARPRLPGDAADTPSSPEASPAK